MLNVYVCLNSQHSRWRLQKFFTQYENLSDYIPLFYGNYFNIEEISRNRKVPDFSNINITELFRLTEPELVVLRVSFKTRNDFLKIVFILLNIILLSYLYNL